MEKNNITLGEELQWKLIRGISQVTNVIRASYGPKGSNVSIESEMMPRHLIANDAQSIIQAIDIKDPVERRGLNFIKELSDKATKDSAEGRKTTIIIAETLLKEGFKRRVGGMDFKERLDFLLVKVLEELDKESKVIELDEIKNIATTSSRSKEIGAIIQNIYREIGRDGIIQVEESGMSDTFHETTIGVKFSGARMLTPTMAYGQADSATYENPIILVTKRKIEKDHDIASVLDKCVKEGRPLVIFCDDMDNGVASRMIATHKAKVCNILVIKAPVLWKNYVFEDFAKCVGATIVEDATGLTFKNLKIEDLGTCEKIVCDSEETVITGTQDISEHKKFLEERGDNDSKLRLQWLNTQTAVLKLGANSESDLSYKLLKTRDAVAACRLALAGGVLAGATKPLFVIGQRLLQGGTQEYVLGLALCAPYRQLQINNGKLINGGLFPSIDTKDVFDSTIVIKNAVKNAIGLAGIVLTTGADIRLKEKTFEDAQLEILYKKNNPF